MEGSDPAPDSFCRVFSYRAREKREAPVLAPPAFRFPSPWGCFATRPTGRGCRRALCEWCGVHPAATGQCWLNRARDKPVGTMGTNKTGRDDGNEQALEEKS